MEPLVSENRNGNHSPLFLKSGWKPGYPETVEDVKLCNCASCQKEILGESMLHVSFQYLRTLFNPNFVPWRIARRWKGRPYCKWCKFTPKEIEPPRYSPYGLPDYSFKPKPPRIFSS